MAGVSYIFETEDGNLLSRLRRMSERMDDLSSFYKPLGEHMIRSTAENFKAETDPDGQAWKPLLPATIARRKKRGQTPIAILRATKNTGLASSISAQADANELRVGSPKEYAAIHQLGGTINKPARKGKIYRTKGEDGKVGNRFVSKKTANHVTDVDIPAHQIKISARPFIGIGGEDVVAIIELADDWLHDF